jgi:exodeoxyribonuclease VII small subunit
MASEPVDSFEDAFRRLEEAVAKLEGGGLPLEEALTLYEEGMRLAQRCQEMLDQAELRVTRLQESFAAYREEGGERALREEIEPYLEENEPLAEG